MNRGLVLGAATVAVTLVLTLMCAEAAARWLGGFPILALRLQTAGLAPQLPSSRETADARYLPQISLATGVDQAWYRQNPPPRPDIPMTAAIAQRYERYKSVDAYGAFFAWNREFLHHEVCAHSTVGPMGILSDFFVFDPPAPIWYPTFRHLSHIRPPMWFPTNQFGWRGPEIAVNKPPGTIRIAYVGSSTTVDPYYLPFSHVEFVGEWLSRWLAGRGFPYHIEVINTARTGIDTMSVAAIVDQEVLPLEPDLVLYEGANDFGPRLQLELAAQRLAWSPPPAMRSSRTEGFSALARRLHAFVARLERRDGSEPRKPAYPIQWPAEVDEWHPDVTQSALPMNLKSVLDRFDAMRTATGKTGGRFGVASPVRMVRDGLKLTLPADETLYNFLNSYYPLTYAQVKRLSDFQQRVFRAYAARYDLLYLDSAAMYPLDPQLFADAVHMTPAGLRLKAWIDLQLLIPWLEREIDSGHLPRPMQHPQAVHPAFASTSYPLVSKAEILASCH